MSFLIGTDSTADLPKKFIEENNLSILSLSYTIKGTTYGKGNDLDDKSFYNMMREGNIPTTSQVNYQEAKEGLEMMAKESKEILYLAFSSGLSGTCNSVSVAARELMDDDPGLNIIVIDTLAASLGEGLLVYLACKMRNEGASLKDTADYIKSHKLNLVHMFTVDDLNHLYRGGRVSKGTAIVGTVLNIKPILHVDDEGHLINIDKVRGRRKSLIALADYMEKKIGSFRDKNEVFFISHGDCLEDAEFLRDEVSRRFGIKDCTINIIGPTIGAHAGPGTVALFFLGDER
jgi:DegV family protein with EDD domain